ncbi:MAG: DUF998 domain-containing protein [Clostridia bacterium]|nr:DUF998 domain-containing protein [Clostridia bacterium]
MKKDREINIRRKRENNYANFLAGFAIIVIPLFTIFLGTKRPPTKYTLSMIGNRFDYRFEYIIWGIVTGGLLVYYILYLFKRANYSNNKAKRFLIWSDVFLVLTVIIPALEEIMPVFAFMHRFFAAAFGVSLVLSLYFFILYLSKGNNIVKRRYLMMLFMVVAGSVFSLFVFGNTGIFELFFFISISLYLIILSTLLKKLEDRKYKKDETDNG